MRHVKIFLLFIFGFSLITGCRYENGPFISFYSPEHRLVSTWLLQKSFRNGVQVTDAEWQANKIGNFYTFHAYGTLVVNTYYEGTLRESYTGSWKFKDNYKKLDIAFSLLDDSYKYTARIKKLSRSELEYEYTDIHGVVWRLLMYAQPY